jgi:hypothetical protein
MMNKQGKRLCKIKTYNTSLLVAAIIVFFVAGCARTRHAVPTGLTQEAKVVGMPGVRAFADSQSPMFIKSLLESFKQERQSDFPLQADGIKVYSTLALSGGGANGAYGAGLLNGWSKEGSRPVFKIVTGISTGALIAPLAFLGSEYDGKLKEFYTTTSSKDIFKKKSVLNIVMGNSLGNTKPLARLIAGAIDNEVLRAIAEAHSKGRRLYIGTTNLDAQRPAVWDMGAIASSGKKGALELFRKIMLASASIPVAFPPIYFDVEAEGKRYDEMHVDGGVTTQVFFLYGIGNLRLAAREAGLDTSKMHHKMYIIRNGLIRPEWQQVKDRTLPIAQRSLSNLIRIQAFGDLIRLYALTKERGGDFNLAFIPDEYVPNPQEEFDPVEMRRLFDLGFKEATKGYAWRKYPPGWQEAEK